MMQHLGLPINKLFVVCLKFRFDWEYCVLPGNLNYIRSHPLPNTIAGAKSSWLNGQINREVEEQINKLFFRSSNSLFWTLYLGKCQSVSYFISSVTSLYVLGVRAYLWDQECLLAQATQSESFQF